MLQNGIVRIVSVDADFDQVEGISRIEPAGA